MVLWLNRSLMARIFNQVTEADVWVSFLVRASMGIIGGVRDWFLEEVKKRTLLC